MQVVGREGNVVLGAVWTQTLCDRRNYNWCDSKTQENLSKVGGRKRNKCAIFDKYMDNPRKMIEWGYYMVKISYAEPGYTRTQLWSEEQGQSERGRRIED
jgi:hypothetical protein